MCFVYVNENGAALKIDGGKLVIEHKDKTIYT